jgi:hypothetical protein
LILDAVMILVVSHISVCAPNIVPVRHSSVEISLHVVLRGCVAPWAIASIDAVIPRAGFLIVVYAVSTTVAQMQASPSAEKGLH